MTPTTEQQTIIAEAKTGKNLAISAFAGAAKTTTCVMIANAIPKRSLYIAFNKSIAEEAKTKFPSWVDCKTLHSLAYQTIIAPEKMYKKVSGFFDTKEFIELYGDQLDYLPPPNQIETIYKVQELIRGFCQSDALDLEEFIKVALEHDRPSYEFYIPLVLQAWAAVTSKSSTVKMTHDVYLKMYQLSNPILEEYDIIYLDEYQDSNPVTLSIVYNQTSSQLIVVGDTYQSIYEWRGAVNAFNSIPDSFKQLYLTESFRFNAYIASIATKLTAIAGNTRPVIGKASNKAIESKAIICRTNMSILNYLIEAGYDNQKVYVIADLQDLWSKMYHISSLASGSKPKYPNADLKRFNNFQELTLEGEHSSELRRLLNISQKLMSGRGTHANIVAIKNVLVEKPEDADFIIVTGHKSKGLEWDEVTLDDDMFNLEDEYSDEQIEPIVALRRSQTLNLLYVAVTRARQKVNLPYSVLDILRDWKDLQEQWEFLEQESLTS